ncbi:aldehyde reductase, partial [Escherichia coli]|nr:aldehyde reductase [Escherichia coli]
AGLQIEAMTHASAAGERFLAVAGKAVSIPEMADILRADLGDAAGNITRRRIPSWLVRILALFNPMAREAAPRLGIRANA